MFRLRTILIVLAAGLLLAGPALAAKTKTRVDAADLATLDMMQLDALADETSGVDEAKARLAEAKVAHGKATTDLQTGKRAVSAESADLVAAKAELKAAKKNQDPERTKVAQVRLREAKSDLATAKLFQRWKQQHVRSCAADVRAAEALVQLKQAELERGRAALLVESGGPAASKYSLADFETLVTKQQIAYDKATAKASQVASSADRAQQSFERASKGDDYSRFAR